MPSLLEPQQTCPEKNGKEFWAIYLNYHRSVEVPEPPEVCKHITLEMCGLKLLYPIFFDVFLKISYANLCAIHKCLFIDAFCERNNPVSTRRAHKSGQGEWRISWSLLKGKDSPAILFPLRLCAKNFLEKKPSCLHPSFLPVPLQVADM